MVKPVALAIIAALALLVTSPAPADARPPWAHGGGFGHRGFVSRGFGGYGFRRYSFHRGYGAYRGFRGRQFGRPYVHRGARLPYYPPRRGFY